MRYANVSVDLAVAMADVATGMILDADEEYESRRDESSGGRAAFKLQSGMAVKKFITIWELFDHRQLFARIIDELAMRALEIRKRTFFTKIITATPTERELGLHVFRRLQRLNADSHLSLHYLGDYPISPLSNGVDAEFQNEQVLVLTDVVTTGSLITNVSQLVHRRGGNVVGVVAVVVTTPPCLVDADDRGSLNSSKIKGLTKSILRFESVNAQKETDPRLFFGYIKLEKEVYYLTRYPIEPLDENRYDKDKLLPIDFNSVLPEINHDGPPAFKALFSMPETISMLEDSDALDFGFYHLEGRRQTCAVDIDRLLDVKGQLIWDRIWRRLKNSINRDNGGKDILLVTTYEQSDLQFKNFIEDGLVGEGLSSSTAVTLKQGAKDSARLHITLGAGSAMVAGSAVVIVLATIYSTEKLRSIVSMLLDNGVRDITVLCLFNRTGFYTAGFFSQLNRFMSQVDGQRQPAGFAFHAVNAFLDLEDGDIRRIHQEADLIFKQYSLTARPIPLQRLADRFQLYFKPILGFREDLARTSYENLADEFLLKVSPEDHLLAGDISETRPKTVEGKIALQTINLAVNRDFTTFLEDLAKATRRRTFIHIYGLILSDIFYLQFTSELGKMKEVLLKRLTSLRKQRLLLEKEAWKNDDTIDEATVVEITSAIHVEVFLLLGLGIIARYDSKAALPFEDASDLLFCGVTAEDWINTYPVNLMRYFTDERIPFVVSFFLRGTFSNLENTFLPRASEAVEHLAAKIQEFRNQFDGLREELLAHWGQKLQAEANMVVNNLDHLLNELGAHESFEKHVVIRHLQREIIKPKIGHSPVFTNLGALKTALEEFYGEKIDQLRDLERNHPLILRQYGHTESILSVVDDALNGTSSLYSISESARRFFQFIPSEQKKRRRYTSASQEKGGFASDIEDIMGTLQRMRSERVFSFRDYLVIEEKFYDLRSDFYDKSSPLRVALMTHILPLDVIVERALLRAGQDLSELRYPDLFKELREKEESRRLKRVDDFVDAMKAGDNELDIDMVEELRTGMGFHLVLSDPQQLQETIRNLLTNIRHSFPDIGELERSKERVQIDLRLEEHSDAIRHQDQYLDAVELVLRVSGAQRLPKAADFSNPQSTVSYQLRWLEDFGMEPLTISDSAESDREVKVYELGLMFISRNEFARMIYPTLLEEKDDADASTV